MYTSVPLLFPPTSTYLTVRSLNAASPPVDTAEAITVEELSRCIPSMTHDLTLANLSDPLLAPHLLLSVASRRPLSFITRPPQYALELFD